MNEKRVEGATGLDTGAGEGVGLAAGPATGIMTGLCGLDPDALLDAKALAFALRVCDRTLRRMVRRHELPPPVSFGGRGRWLAGAVLSHFKARAARAEKEAAREIARLKAL